MIKINTSGDYVQLIYVDPVQESVQQELKSNTDAFECSYDSDGKLFMQFGAMRFENPDPTDFTINGVAVTDAADFISKLNSLFTGSGGGWGTTGTIATLTGDGTVDLNGNQLIFQQNGIDAILINRYAAHTGWGVQLLAQTPGTDTHVAIDAGDVPVLMLYSSDGVKTTSIEFDPTGNADLGSSGIAYTADTHTFNVTNILRATDGNNDLLDINPAAFEFLIGANNDSGTFATVSGRALTGDVVDFHINATDGANSVAIDANAIAKTITYNADTHTFNFGSSQFIFNGADNVIQFNTLSSGGPVFGIGLDQGGFQLDAGIGGTGQYIADTHTMTGAVLMPSVIPLDFADDAAAAIGGVAVGALYHNAGAVRIRRS